MSEYSGKTIRKNEDNFVETDVDGERLIMRVDEGYFYTLNPTGDAFWSGIDTEPAVDRLYAKIAKDFSVDPAICTPDLDELLADLEKNALVTLV